MPFRFSCDARSKGRNLEGGFELLRYPVRQHTSVNSARALSFLDGTCLWGSQIRLRSIRLDLAERPITAALDSRDPVGADLADIGRAATHPVITGGSHRESAALPQAPSCTLRRSCPTRSRRAVPLRACRRACW